MATALQNRLVGTVILVALAVIFLPDILDGEKQQNRELFVDVPPQPVVRPVIAPEAFPAEEVKQAASRPVEVVDEQAVDDPAPNNDADEQASEESASQTSENDTQDEEPSALAVQSDTSSLADQTVVEQDPDIQLENSGWVIQLGSFRHQKNVRDLLTKLEKAGYRAFSRPVQTSSGVLTKVFVGPDLQRDNLTAALPHLKEETGLVGRITPFTVE
ncbi:SPOR domain-containing protein [Aestuariibacter salexigens]|uniref:SPOR domain-containing protein n=1 Tax=Aestuariibacter salexigens TaxID=226010 RepID=UPI00041BEDE1|nr:SPOR domain-containing protein [Aestuariibacter salexigens]